MQIFITVALALGLANHGLGAVVTSNVERAVVQDSRVIHVNGIDITVGTVPVPKDRLDALANATVRARSPVPETTLVKRVVNNCCFYGCPSRTCVNGLSTSPDPPASADCVLLGNAIQSRAASERAGKAFPCNLPNQPSCPNFTVQPGTEYYYSYGTCLVGFINRNPTGGPAELYCDYLMAGVINSTYTDCMTNQGKTGGYCVQSSSSGFLYAIELRHV